MALFHLSVTQTKRSAGQSAIASAAYRAGERLYSEYYGEYSDYTRKGGVICSDILLPSHAPPEYADRQTLWNAVEKAERGKNAQLAYSFDIALQNEFSLEENIALARQFLLENFVSRGMVVDFAVHQPDREDGGIPNPHFHVLCPIRPIEQNGKWGLKQRRVYELDEDGNRIRDQNGKFVFNAVPTTDWGSPETLEHWREAWAELCNAKFAEKGIDVRIDHRSYERQGVELLPTVHEGATVRAMEKKGIRTEKGEFNRWIKATNATMYDELELDKLGDRKTALFLIMSDTDSTFNFLISMIYTQLFNLLCDKADDVYGGRLPVHVRCLIDECANIGQIPQLEKLVATIRSREISACLVLQTRSQLKAIYKDNADTIVGNMDSQIFLGGSEPTTLKDLAEALGKETIDSYNNSDTRGNSPSYGTNYQKLGHELMSRDELAVLDGGKCILQLRGVRPFLSDKYDLTQHPNYKYTSDYDPKNALDIEKFLNRKEKIHPDDTFIMVDADSLPPA